MLQPIANNCNHSIQDRGKKRALDELQSGIGRRSHLTDSCTSFSRSHRQTVMPENTISESDPHRRLHLPTSASRFSSNWKVFFSLFSLFHSPQVVQWDPHLGNSMPVEQGVAVERDEGPQRLQGVFHIKLQKEQPYCWNNS